MRVIFMGSAELACPSLQALLLAADMQVVGVVTQPDRPKGRRLQPSPCATKALVQDSGVPVLTPEKVNAPAVVEELRALRPDVLAVVAYGQILKAEILALPPLGCINVHGSLLPAYRGAAPIQWAVVNGERETGVTIMHMNARMDAGDIILQRRTPIGAGDTAETLHDRLARLGAEALLEALRLLRAGKAPRVPQDEGAMTLAPKLRKEDGRLDWTQPALALERRVRGFHPWPGCHAVVPAGVVRAAPCLLKVHAVRVEAGSGAPGEILEVNADGPLVATGDGALRLLVIQPEGGRSMDGGAFVCGHALKAGLRLE